MTVIYIFFTNTQFYVNPQPCQEFLYLGNYSGEVKMFNVRSGTEEATYSCHDSYVTNVKCNKRGDLLLTSTTWRNPVSALWSLGAFFDMKIPFDADEWVEFSKSQDRIVGTQGEVAAVSKTVMSKIKVCTDH